MTHINATITPAPTPAENDVVIRALGRFTVYCGGKAVPPSRWQSRKARDLLRILVARRGGSVPRAEMCEVLWPDDAPQRTGHRLSVLLSIVRAILDPARQRAVDHYLRADRGCLALDIAKVRVDVEDFLELVARGHTMLRQGDVAGGHGLLVSADRQYGADAFADEPYADWSDPLREETRAAHLTTLRTLAHINHVAAEPALAAGYLLRLLEQDPYDEPAHLALVRVLVDEGQHGEARRAFARYANAMSAIDVAAPDALILVPGGLRSKSVAAAHR